MNVRRALLFDFDGLIVDSETVHATGIIELLAEDGVPAALEDIAHLYGGTGGAIDDGWNALIGRWGTRVDFGTFEERLFRRIDPLLAELPLLPGVRRLLDVARGAGWRTGLATGRRPDRLEPELDRLELRAAFDAVVTASEVARGKPAPDIFLEAARRLHVEPRDCVVLEDSVPGSQAALAAGMTVYVCPCPVTALCAFPDGAVRVDSLAGLELAGL